MQAIDTNILVRLIAQDDPDQCVIAESVTDQPFIVLPTVLLETVWVLQSRYRTPAAEIISRLRLILGSSHAYPVSGEAMEWAIARYAEGADFADAFHLALADEIQATSFAAFDKGVSKITDPPLRIEMLA